MELWYVLVVVAVVAVALLLARGRRSRGGAAVGSTPADFVQGREDARVSGMSQEDRDWEAASLQRDADRRGPGEPG